jgi:hypothetical protein
MKHLTRRGFLRGLGVCVALPAFESLASPACAVAEAIGGASGAPLAVTAGGMPLRMAFVAFANGVNYQRWTPRGAGKSYELNEGFKSITDLKDRFQVITSLKHAAAEDWGDGPGDHARAGATYLTGCHAWKSNGARLQLGISADQIAAQNVGHLTRIDSLQLGVEGERFYGSCDTGYPCAYQYNISWASETLPLPPEANPRIVFERLFGTGPAEQREASLRKRMARRKSVLDYVLEDARSLNRTLGGNDRQKMDEYLTGVRKLEREIEKSERFKIPNPGEAKASEIPADHQLHVDLMYDLMALAFQTDSTRVISYCVAPEGSNRPFLDLGIPEGHHYLTHHKGDQEKIAKVVKIENWYMQRFARFLKKLDEMKEPNGTSVLDNSMIVYGSALGDGDRHNHDELPCVLAGRGGGTLTPGQHVKLDRPTPMTNLFIAMLDRMGVKAQRVGDSTGVLEGI